MISSVFHFLSFRLLLFDRRLVSVEEALVRRYFGNWKGKKPRPDAPVVLGRAGVGEGRGRGGGAKAN